MSNGLSPAGPKMTFNDVILELLGTKYGWDKDPKILTFQTGLLCVADLVPGSIPQELIPGK